MVVEEREIKYRRKKHKVNWDRVFDIAITVVMFALAFLFLLPLLYVLSCSFTEPEVVLAGEAKLFPVHFSLVGYQKVFKESLIWSGFRNSLIYTTIGTAISVIIELLCAYPLSRRDFGAKKVINMIFVLTMFVSGGMIPNYLLISELGLFDTMWAIILPSCGGVFSIIVVRTYMTSSIPYELQEAARVDGCSDFGIFARIIIPLSRPIIFVTTLFALVGFWNSYFSSLLYLQDPSLFPLQRVLQDIIVPAKQGAIGSDTAAQEQLKYVTIVVSSVPLLVIYPFFQKYFEKGMVVGGIKG